MPEGCFLHAFTMADPMRITRYTDYALRVLMYLGLKNQEQTTIREIAEHYSISKNHLMKVVQQLSADGYVHATPGKRGGLRLQQKAEEINIGRLVRRLEQDSVLVDCFGSASSCVVSPICQLKHTLGRALEAFFSVLDEYTLADLLPDSKRPQLIELLQITNVAAD